MRLIIAVHLRVKAHQAGEQRGARAGMPVDEEFFQGEEAPGLRHLFKRDRRNFRPFSWLDGTLQEDLCCKREFVD